MNKHPLQSRERIIKIKLRSAFNFVGDASQLFEQIRSEERKVERKINEVQNKVVEVIHSIEIKSLKFKESFN